MTTDTRLGTVEGRTEEHAGAIADLREGQREIRETMNSRFDEMNSRIDQVNGRVDRLFFAILGIGAAQITAQIALLVTLIVRT